jgi:hypothetical protein
MPTGIAPDDDPDGFSFPSGDGQPGDEQHPPGFTAGLAGTELPIDLGGILPSGSKAVQRFLLFAAFRFAWYPVQGFTRSCPGLNVG